MPDRPPSSIRPPTVRLGIARLIAVIASCLPMAAVAQDASTARIAATSTTLGWTVVALFVVSYALVALEERLHLRKSKPVMLAATLIWGLIAWSAHGDPVQSTLVSA